MFLLPSRQIWTQPPQGAVEVDLTSPLAKGLGFAWSSATPDREMLTGTLGVKIGAGLSNDVGRNGKAARATANNGLQFDFPKFSNGSNKWTVASFCINDAGYNNNRNPFDGDAPAEARIFQLRLDGDNRPNFIAFDTTVSGVVGVTASAPIVAGAAVMLVGRVDGNEASVWADGKFGASGSISGTPILPSASNAKLKVGTYGSVASGAAGNFPGQMLWNLFWNRALSASEIKSLSDNPWQIFAPRETRLFVPVGGGGSVNSSASGALSAVAVTAPSASASGSASATGALATITISYPTATASGGGSASASGSFAALSISPATATATATKSATASGAFAVVSISAPTATASGTTAGGANATGAPAQITISHAAAIAIGSAVASGGYQSIGITAPTGSASVGNGNATASGTWAAISITAPAAYASSGFIRAPSGSGPTVIQPGSYRPSQSATSRPINTGGRRY